MADGIDDAVSSWIGTVVEGVQISLSLPNEKKTGEGVALYLLEMAKAVPISAAKPAPLQLTLRYLVTAWAETPEKAHASLAQLMFAAMEHGEFEVERDPPSLELWRSLGMTPQPAFLLRKPLVKERTPAPAVYVREPVRVQFVARAAFFGQVLGPGDSPVPNCAVEVPGLGLATRTDRDGQFQFANLPAAGKVQIVLKARGREMSINSEERSTSRGTPTVMHFTSLED